jgi:hypothetical protein
MLVPPIVATVVIYAVLIVIQSIPRYFGGQAVLQDFWVTLPLSFVSLAIPVFLFLAVFAINEKRAILVPICGVFAAALLEHYLTRFPAEFGFEQVRLRNDLWQAIKYALPSALLVAGLGMVAARWWAPRAEGDSSRFVIPPVKPALILFAVSVVLGVAMIIALNRGVTFYYPGAILHPALSDFAVIAMCSICAVAMKSWTALLPLALIVQSYIIFFTLPDGCSSQGAGGETCWDLLWPIFRNSILVFGALFVLSVIAGAWAREKRKA